ncbi:hypothetical protein [Microtetraspora sp. AC03309]|uniref:hypothetical protein n=1 Tax=Microtetraspora sp. AC03309 TaxID=2779376 RepID=UPI001E5B3D49|nr:hypothetical protein [Microtetraspora sp. AC03309]
MPCRDRLGVPYEVTLELYRDGVPYGTVGERCGWFLARLARVIADARADGGPQAGGWPDPEDRFPGGDEGEMFALRYRSRIDVVGGGELRCQVRTMPSWIPARRRGGVAPLGEWRLTRRAFLEAWGASGVGLRAELTSGRLAAFVEGLVGDAEEILGGSFEMERNSNLTNGAVRVSRPR